MDKKDLLKEITEKYWESYEPTDIDRSLERYLEPQEALEGRSLLEAELEYAYAKGKIEAQPCSTLVMMVGYSLEPLLQSVCVYQPQKIVLLLNEGKDDEDRHQPGYGKEEWFEFAKHVTEAIGHLVNRKLLKTSPEVPGENDDHGYPVVDSPEAVFQKLVEVLHDEKDVVIDVTGGKKSMTSGAYMYAAYAGVRISYVDFDKYDPKRRRPYGYSCRIEPLENPYQAFALREWERVRALYKRYQFREARRILDGEVLPAMEQWQPEAVSAVEKLERVLEFYERWDRGDFRGAYQYANAQLSPDFPKPSAVTRLGPKWYEISGNEFVQTPSRFYGNSEDVKVYACDELARIERLIEYNEDYRSAFLRAGGLNEVVLVARLAQSVEQAIRKDLLRALDYETPSAGKLLKELGNPNPNGFDWEFRKRETKTAMGVKKLSIPSIGNPMRPWWNNTEYRDFGSSPGWKKFLDRRNLLAHTYFSVPDPWAQGAKTFVKANVEDFWGKRVEEMGVQTSTLPWPELCERTGINRFLPPNLLQKEDQS